MNFPVLTVLVLLPGAGALLVAVMPNRRPELIRLVAAVVSVATAAMTVWVLSAFDTGDAGFQLVSKHLWVPPWDISWHLGVDGISLFLVVLTGVLFPLVIFGIDPHHDVKRYLAWMLLLEAGMMGSFLSLDLFLFFVFFEIVLVPMYFLIAGWGYEQRVYAATKFFLYTMIGSAFMFVGVVATSVLARSNGVGRITFDLVEIAEKANFAASTGRWLFFAFAVYERRRFKAVEPEVLEHAWYYDSAISAVMGGPGRRAFDALNWFDRTIVDGAVNGVGRLVRGSAGGVRKVQTGYVRQYASALAVGIVLLLVWFVVFRGIAR
jgi:NADH-quinone oxidoreductase subunit M